MPARTITVGAKAQFTMIVSDEDYDFLSGFLWTFARSHPGANELIYARRCVRVDGRKFDLFAHHVVLGRMGKGESPPEPGWTADHKNGDTLDNRRSNLRWASPALQATNQRRRSHARNLALAAAEQRPEIPF